MVLIKTIVARVFSRMHPIHSSNLSSYLNAYIIILLQSASADSTTALQVSGRSIAETLYTVTTYNSCHPAFAV